jgi:hypothetical protein
MMAFLIIPFDERALENLGRASSVSRKDTPKANMFFKRSYCIFYMGFERIQEILHKAFLKKASFKVSGGASFLCSPAELKP